MNLKAFFKPLGLVYLLFCGLLLIYMLSPMPKNINQVAALPNAEKSNLDGDTWQIPNVKAYFSNNYRDFATNFYRQDFQTLNHLPFPPLRLNHPPEYAFTAIKKYTDSTYLEEMVYPLRDSLFVNGFEAFYQDGQPKYWGAIKFDLPNGRVWDTKVTLRLYPSSIWVRLIVWFGISMSILLLYILGKEVVLDD